MPKLKALFVIALLLSFTLLEAQEAYEKEFKNIIEEMVRDGNISSVSGVACQKGDCRIDGLVVVTTDAESGVHSSFSAAQFKVKNAESFIAFKNKKSALKEGEERQFGFELKDVRVDGHNLLFDDRRMAQELGEKSAVYRYLKKHLDTPTDGSYMFKARSEGGDVKMDDSGRLSIGKFELAAMTKYTIKGGFEKLASLSQENPVGMLSYIVINSIDIKIKNPKGFLRKLLYVNYKDEMHKAALKEERARINESYNLLDDRVHSENEFGEMQRVNARIKIKELALKDPAFDAIINPDRQLEKKVDAILLGESESVSIIINNPHGLSLGDFFIIFIGYAMQEEFVVKPDITITVK
jgi:hypothetical protein